MRPLTMEYDDDLLTERALSAAIVINRERSANSNHRPDVTECYWATTIRHAG